MSSTMTRTVQQKEGRLETVRQKFWPEDISQLQELEEQWNQEPLSYLLCQAMHIGVLVLSTSGGPRVATGRYGLYTTEELIAELGPRLAPSAFFLERNGYSIIPVPASLAPLVEQFAQRHVSASHLSPVDLRDHFQEREDGEEADVEGDDDRWRFWKKDLQQLRVLHAQWGSTDRLVYLRSMALHIGTLVLSTSNAPSRTDWKYGLYTAIQLAEALSPCLAGTIQLLERNGYSLIPVPTAVNVLIQLVTRLISSDTARTLAKPSLENSSSSTQTKEAVEQSSTATGEARNDTTTKPSESSPRAIMSEQQRKKRGIAGDGDI